jgi:hypothetical protein
MTTKTKTTKSAKAKIADAPSVIRTICTEMKLDPKVARRRLRSAGMKAPYTDASAIRKALDN